MAIFIETEINARYYTNDYNVLGGEALERMVSLSGVRPSATKVFSTPRHTIGTPSLLIFLDGKLQALDVDYTDSNSNQIEFIDDIGVDRHYEAILVANTGESGTGNINWEEF